MSRNFTPSIWVTGVILVLFAGPSWDALINPTESDSNGNTAGGSGVLVVNEGSSNTAFGHLALSSNTVGSYNTGFGKEALRFNTEGNGNTALGAYALSNNYNGMDNTAIGESALYQNTAGIENTALGSQALLFNKGSYNTATGTNSLFSNQVGQFNTANGANALRYNTDASWNTAAGHAALRENITGYSNTASGESALILNTEGFENTAAGASALRNNTKGDKNTADGTSALVGNTTGNNNTAVGYNALKKNTIGSNNIAVGYLAGQNLTQGNNNIYLGHGGGGKESNTLRLGSSTQTRTFIAGVRGRTTGQADAVAVFIDSKGQLGTVNSSQRFKEDIRDMNEASRRLFDLRPVTFHYREATADGRKPLEYGLIAEEVAQVYPGLVTYGADGKIETVQYHKLTPMLLNEVQRLNKLLQAERDKNLVQTEQLKAQEVSIKSQENRLMAELEQNQAQAQEIAILKQQMVSMQIQVQRMEDFAARLTRIEAKDPSGAVADAGWVKKGR